MPEEQYYGVKAGTHVHEGYIFKPGDVMKLTREGFERRCKGYTEKTAPLELAGAARRIKHSGKVRSTGE